ncbi:MAG: phosphoribosylglycinamide formyltransferase [Pseudomonadota bacterium]
MSAARTAILISGSGTNLQAFIDAAACGDIALDIALVFSNVESAYGLERARQAGIDTVALSHRDFENREDFDRAVARVLDAVQPDLIVLAGFMRILSAWFVRRYAGRILNIHPALLPLYPGLNTHQRAIDAGDTWHGSTVHFVTEELDGGPRVLAGRLRIDAGDDADSLNHRIQSIEHRIYPRAADWVARGRVRFANGAALLDNELLVDPVVEDFD